MIIAVKFLFDGQKLVLYRLKCHADVIDAIVYAQLSGVFVTTTQLVLFIFGDFKHFKYFRLSWVWCLRQQISTQLN
jgi:hypothetical protein